MRKLRILIDMDDTIENLAEAWCAWLNKRYGLSVNHKDIDSWGAITDLYGEWGLSAEDVFYPLYHESEFWDTVTPKQDAIEYIKMLKDDGHQIFIVTNSYASVKADKFEKVLFRHFPYLDYTNLIITHDKSFLKADVIIDDNLNYVLGSCAKLKLLYNASHNKDFDDPFNEGIYRVNNWAEIYLRINSWMHHDNEILNFIEKMNNFDSPKDLFTNGFCYWFTEILQTWVTFYASHPTTATKVYDPVANHFGVKVGYNVYDITGDVTDEYDWVDWIKYKNQDELESARITRDCISMED